MKKDLQYLLGRKLTLILWNAMGQEIFSRTIGEKESINFSSLSEGSYFLELISEKGNSENEIYESEVRSFYFDSFFRKIFPEVRMLLGAIEQ